MNARRRYDSAPVIRAPRRFLRSSAGNLRASLGVAWPLFLANMRARHRRALLGYIWLVIPGLASAAAFTMLRKSEIFSVGETSLPYALFVLSGIFLWQTFVDGLTLPMQHMLRQRYFLSIVPAPHDGILLAALAEIILNLLIRLVILEAAMLLLGMPPAVQWVLLPIAGLAMAITGYSAGLLLIPLSLLYDDVGPTIGIIATFGMFLTPVLYPIPHDSILASIPLVPLMTVARDWMSGNPAGESLLPTSVLALGLLLVGWLLNAAARPHLSARAH